MPRIATRGDVSNPKRKGYDFRIDDFLFRAAIGPNRQMSIESSDVRGQEIDVRQNAEDFTRNLGRIYSRNDFSGGSNLDIAHRRNGGANDITRFWDSKGIEVFGKDKGTSYDLQLLHTTQITSGTSFSSTDNDNALVIVGTDIYISDDNVLKKSTDGGDTFSTVTTGLTSGYHIKGLAAHGDLLYITANNGSAGEIESLTSGGTSTQKMSAAIYDKIFSVKGKFLVTIGNAIHQYDGDTTVGSAIVTLPSGQTFTDVADVGAVILATATDGRIYAIKDVTGTFTVNGQTELSSNEIPTCVAEVQGEIFYGTKEVQTSASKVIGRLYRASITVANDLYVLANQQLIKEWNIDSVTAQPMFLFTTRDSVYTGIKESSSDSYLWRYYLPSAGIARDLEFEAGGLIKGINKINEKLIAIVSESGFYKETDNFKTEGYLISAAADFFTAEKKQFVEAQIETSNMVSGTSAELHISDNLESINDKDDSNWDLALNIISGEGTVTAQTNKVSRYIAMKLVIKSADASQTPKVQAIQTRALARPELVVVQIPVNLSDRVERPFRKPITVKNLGETIYQSLKDKEGSSVTLELFDPAEVIRGVVESIQYPITGQLAEIGSVTQYAIITVRGTRQEVYGSVTSGNIYAVNSFGKVRFA
tara:strand:- start:3609 stop:5552 length:1944 start_codon:yes stop_codon:yes gene_type:complete